jgi:mRNA (guanine-N7-)-methyltransferase
VRARHPTTAGARLPPGSCGNRPPASAAARRFAHGADSLLDLACGRGGDIRKWFDAGVGFVKGIDLSPGEVAEARQRYEELRRERPAARTTCQFADTPALGLQEWKEDRQYDVVTCMFALHYFFVAEKALHQFLHNVAANLKPGGFFVGTVPDGKRVNECIRVAKSFDSPMLRIQPRWAGAPAAFGSPYLCAIGDTVTGSEKDTEGSLEYLVYGSVLAGVAAQHGLRPVLNYQDPAMEGLFDPGDAAALLKHFAPRFPGADPSLERASALFAAFVFRKDEAQEPAAAPPARLPRAADLAPVKQPGGGVGKGAKRGREDDDDGGGGGDVPAGGPDSDKEAEGVAEGEQQAQAAPKAPAFKRPPPRRRPGAAGPAPAQKQEPESTS